MEGAGAMEEDNAPPMSKKEKAKLVKLAEKNLRKQMQAAQVHTEEEDPLAGNCGDMAMEDRRVTRSSVLSLLRMGW